MVNNQQIKDLIKYANMEEAVEILIGKGLCINKSQARRVYLQLGGVK